MEGVPAELVVSQIWRMHRVKCVEELEKLLLRAAYGRVKGVEGLMELRVEGDQSCQLFVGDHACKARRFSASFRKSKIRS